MSKRSVCERKQIWFVTFLLKKRSWRSDPEPEAAATCNGSTSYVFSSASLALPVALLGLAYGRFSSLHPSTYPGTMLDFFSISDSIMNKSLRQLSIICLCIVTFMLGVFLRKSGSENSLGTVDLVCFPSWKYPLKILLTFSFFPCLLHSETPFSMLGDLLTA